jgi:hypothetical protein
MTTILGLGFTIILLLSASHGVLADGVVGNGTPESCTEVALGDALAGGGSITFDCGPNPYTLTISSEKVIAANTSVDGDDRITISGGGTTRVFSVTAGVTLSLTGLNISNGHVAGCDEGGGVFNAGTLIVSDITFMNNSVESCSDYYYTHVGYGGAIYNANILVVQSSKFISNNAGRGAGLYNVGTATVSDSTFRGNKAAHGTYVGTIGEGGAIDNSGTLLIEGSQFEANSAARLGWITFSEGGAIYNTGSAKIAGSLFLSNTAAYGGGIINSGRLDINGSSFHSNSAHDVGYGEVGRGGAIDNTGVLTVNRSAFLNNSSLSGGGLASSGHATLVNTIIANNAATDEGSGLRVGGSGAHLLHNTIARNAGSAVYVHSNSWLPTTLDITNTIFYSQAIALKTTGYSTVTLQGVLWFKNVADTAGTGVISITQETIGDPAFIDPATGDYHIAASSAARDAGVTSEVRVDIDSEPRFDIPDLGADEYWAPGTLKRVYLPLVLKQ